MNFWHTPPQKVFRNQPGFLEGNMATVQKRGPYQWCQEERSGDSAGREASRGQAGDGQSEASDHFPSLHDRRQGMGHGGARQSCFTNSKTKTAHKKGSKTGHWRAGKDPRQHGVSVPFVYYPLCLGDGDAPGSRLPGCSEKMVDLKKRTVTLPEKKNGEKRIVPLLSGALLILSEVFWSLDGSLWGITEDPASRVCNQARVEGLTFQGLRHEATSRLFERDLNPMEEEMPPSYWRPGR